MVTNKLKNLGINSPTPPGQTRTCFSGHKIRLEELSKPVKIMKKTIHLKDFEGNWKYCCMKPPHGKKILVVSSWYATDLPNHWLEITRNLNYHSARDIPWYIIPIKSHEIPLTPIKSLLLMGKPPMHPHDLPRLATTCHPRMPLSKRGLQTSPKRVRTWRQTAGGSSRGVWRRVNSVRGGRIHGKITMNGSLKHIRSPCRKNSMGNPPFSMGKSTYKWSFSIAMLNYQRVPSGKLTVWPWKWTPIFNGHQSSKPDGWQGLPVNLLDGTYMDIHGGFWSHGGSPSHNRFQYGWSWSSLGWSLGYPHRLETST